MLVCLPRLIRVIATGLLRVRLLCRPSVGLTLRVRRRLRLLPLLCVIARLLRLRRLRRAIRVALRLDALRLLGSLRHLVLSGALRIIGGLSTVCAISRLSAVWAISLGTSTVVGTLLSRPSFFRLLLRGRVLLGPVLTGVTTLLYIRTPLGLCFGLCRPGSVLSAALFGLVPLLFAGVLLVLRTSLCGVLLRVGALPAILLAI
jgi:hypothetical protein